MLRYTTSGLCQSIRQVRREAARKQQKQQRLQTVLKRSKGTKSTVCGPAREQSIITNQQKQTFGRIRHTETMPRVAAVGAMGLLNLGVIDALNLLLQDLADDDDDGR